MHSGQSNKPDSSEHLEAEELIKIQARLGKNFPRPAVRVHRKPQKHKSDHSKAEHGNKEPWRRRNEFLVLLPSSDQDRNGQQTIRKSPADKMQPFLPKFHDLIN